MGKLVIYIISMLAITTWLLTMTSMPISQASERKQPVIYIFTADWCTYCHQMAKERVEHPYLRAELEHFDVKVLDYDKNRALAARYYVFAVPTMIAVDPNSGRVVTRRMGYNSPGTVVATLRSLRR